MAIVEIVLEASYEFNLIDAQDPGVCSPMNFIPLFSEYQKINLKNLDKKHVKKYKLLYVHR